MKRPTILLLTLAISATHPLHAQATPTGLPNPNSYEAMGWIAGTFFAIAGGVLVIVTLWQKINPRRTPALEAEFATKIELVAHRAEVDARFAAMSSSSAAGREKIYNKIDETNTTLSTLGHDVASLTTANEHLNQHLIRLETKMDALLQRKS